MGSGRFTKAAHATLNHDSAADDSGTSQGLNRFAFLETISCRQLMKSAIRQVFRRAQ
jgi:hypothetical protein